MKTNVEKVLERDQKLSELDDRAGKLNLNSIVSMLLRTSVNLHLRRNCKTADERNVFLALLRLLLHTLIKN